MLFVLFKKYLLESGVDNDHIIEIALDGIENEELRDPKKCYHHINGLAPQGLIEIRELILKLNREQQITVLICMGAMLIYSVVYMLNGCRQAAFIHVDGVMRKRKFLLDGMKFSDIIEIHLRSILVKCQE